MWLFLLACSTENKDEIKEKTQSRTLTLAAYTTPREAYGKAVLPAFAAHWKKEHGEEVQFQESYQGSGAQARAVVEGFEADVVALSLDPDVQLIEKAGLITHDWRSGPGQGIVTRSIAVIAVRPGNPKKINDWSDLNRADIEVLTPNVRTSGGAMWNVAAIWGAALRGHAGGVAGDSVGAEGVLAGILGRVRVMDKSGRESIVSFEKGVGDAAITYENEVLVARQEGKQMDYVVPSSTILIENPIAVVDRYADKHQNRDLAEAFVAFTLSPEAQKAYSSYGLRTSEQNTLPQPTDLFTIRDLGGWQQVQDTLFAANTVYDRALAKAQTH